MGQIRQIVQSGTNYNNWSSGMRSCIRPMASQQFNATLAPQGRAGPRRLIAMKGFQPVTRWLHLTLSATMILCNCSRPTLYENSQYLNYGAAEFNVDLARCRLQSTTLLASVGQSYALSRTGVDEYKVNACMALQGWRQAPPSVAGVFPF